MEAPKGMHPDTARAFDHVDAMLFTGDPGETREIFEFIDAIVSRWHRRMQEVTKAPWFKEA
jgi:hypothetical protein